MTWQPNRQPLNRNVALPFEPRSAAATPWKDQKGARRRRLRELTPERKNLVQRLKDGSLTFEGYARELIRIDQQLGRG